MKPQFQHKITTSYLLWFENYFFKKSEAYTKYTGKLTYFNDERLPDEYSTFGTQYKQMIYDSSLPNAYIPSGMYINGSFVPNEQNKFIFDFDNGRFIASGVPTGASVTGEFTAKDINIYYTNDTEENIVLNVQEKINESVDNKHQFYAPYEQKLPAIYLSNESIHNEAFAFGGLNETMIKAKSVIIANNSYELDCILSIFSDSYNQLIPVCDFDSHPFNEYGGLKTGYYSYDDIKDKYKTNMYVKHVTASKMSDKLKQNLLKDLYIGFLDFNFSVHRYSS